MPITFDSNSMPTPYIIAFTCAEGVKIGTVVKWISKLWQVKLNAGLGCYVSPSQVLWLE